MDKYAKAIVGTIIAGLGSVEVALNDGVITGVEWIQIASAIVAAAGLIWGVTNTPSEPQ